MDVYEHSKKVHLTLGEFTGADLSFIHILIAPAGLCDASLPLVTHCNIRLLLKLVVYYRHAYCLVCLWWSIYCSGHMCVCVCVYQNTTETCDYI